MRTMVVTTKDPYDVYVGRAFRTYAKPGPKNPKPGLFGNPYKGDEGGKAWQELYLEYLDEKLANDSAFGAAAFALRGKRIACFCRREAGQDISQEQLVVCHADLLAARIDGRAIINRQVGRVNSWYVQP